jgi:hypothetical protein
MLNEVKHLAIVWEILRCAQNDIVHHLTCDRALVLHRINSKFEYRNPKQIQIRKPQNSKRFGH